MRALVVAAVAAAAAVPADASAKPFAQRTSVSKRTTTAQVVPRSIFARAPSFGTVRHTSSAPLTATHVEVIKTPPSSVTDRHWNKLGRYLSIRGGHDENIGESTDWNSCTAYSTVGIVNLLPADDQEDVGTTLARHLVEELLPTSSSCDDDDDDAWPKLICLPSGGESSALLGNFGGSSEGSTSDASTLASYETIGTVSDTVYVLAKEGDEKGNDASIGDVVSVLKGLARRIGGDSNNGFKPKLVVYVQNHANHQGYVRYLLRSALAKLMEDNSKSKWDSISTLQGDVDVVALPYTAENVAEMAATGRMFASHRQNDAPKAVPLSSFETLATQVYQALSRSAATGIEFHAVRDVSKIDELSDIDEVTYSEAFAESGAVGNTDDMNYDDAPSELESEDPVEYDDISVEAESVDGANDDGTKPVPLDAPRETARSSPVDPDMIFAELTGASRRILLECERKMGDLEAKQDEFLLNSDQGMPILEFGSDAQAIVDYAAASFEQIAADATEAAEIDDSIQSQIKDENESAHGRRRHLFELQLQSLRQYYGRRYEAVLDEMLGGASEGGESRSKEKQEAILTAAAQRAAEGFRTAAGTAMPSSCRDGSVLESLDFGIVITRDLNGLMQDMIEATQLRQELEEDWDNAATGEVEAQDIDEEGPANSEEGIQTRRQRKGPAKWYEKIAARAFVLVVNYLQGWLALQQLRKAAADRDKAMPKFPLF